MTVLPTRRSVPPGLAQSARLRLDRACPPRPGWQPGSGAAGFRDDDEGPPAVEDVPPAASAVPGRDDAGDAGGGRAPGWLPLPLRGGTLVVSARAVLGLALVVVLAVAVAGSYFWRSRAAPVAEPAPVQRVPRAVSSATASAPGGKVVVHVAGRVRSPGVRTLPPGARVGDAVAAAGGAGRDADTGAVNLARPLVDGEQVLIPTPGAAPGAGAPAGAAGPSGAGPAGSAGSGSGGSGGAAGGGPVDVNTATSEQLQELPGVGPVLAQRILDWRQQHGRFSSVEELREVEGIGERKYADLSPRVRV